jgi:ADP-heptose:LPS heptosyltransferase
MRFKRSENLEEFVSRHYRDENSSPAKSNMLFDKHIKLFRKFLGAVVRPKFGMKSNLVRIAKSIYLLASWLIEICGDILFVGRLRNGPVLSAPRRILIVKTDQLGDVIFSTLLPRAIKHKYPDVRIDYLVRPNAAHVLEKNPHVNDIYHWNNLMLELLPVRGDLRKIRTKLAENRAVASILRSNAYDIVINARAYPPSSNRLLRGFGRTLIAFDIAEQSFLADCWADYDLNEEEPRNYAKLLAPLGIASSLVSSSSEFYNYDARNPGDGLEPYVVFAPVSFEIDRQWKTEYWKELIAILLAQRINVALSGLPSQRAYLESIVPAWSLETSFVRLLTDLSVQQLGALMKGAAFFVGIESFPAHLAIALGIPAAFLINPNVYYLKGHSRRTFAREARSILPIVPKAAFFDVRSASADEIVASFQRLQPVLLNLGTRTVSLGGSMV